MKFWNTIQLLILYSRSTYKIEKSSQCALDVKKKPKWMVKHMKEAPLVKQDLEKTIDWALFSIRLCLILSMFSRPARLYFMQHFTSTNEVFLPPIQHKKLMQKPTYTWTHWHMSKLSQISMPFPQRKEKCLVIMWIGGGSANALKFRSLCNKWCCYVFSYNTNFKKLWMKQVVTTYRDCRSQTGIIFHHYRHRVKWETVWTGAENWICQTNFGKNNGKNCSCKQQL